MDLFSLSAQKKLKKEAPLAARMRPRTLDEFIGQEEIVGEGRLLRRAIQADRLTSMIFYGPPGCGKTTLARVIANTTQSEFETLNAVTSGVKDIREVIEKAKKRYEMYQKRTILFIDEIHRFNKAQQDALLPAVEDGTIIFIGATTENPYFEINSPLISRSRIFQLRPLTQKEIKIILKNALKDKERGLGNYKVRITDKALNHLANVANGDARSALNALELAVLTTPENEDGVINIDLEIAEESIQKRAVNYDKDGDNHYDTISAFIKSMRGSDPDATLYWLAKMIKAGEDPRFIARRILIHAAEDVGLANPHALIVAAAAAQAVEYVGMPEARIPLAEAALFIATAPKSNAVIKGIDSALEVVEKEEVGSVPKHLKDTHYLGASKLGHGEGYKYPHDFPGNYVPQEYLPLNMKGRKFYHPTENGYEKQIKEYLKRCGDKDE
ncbi:AAA family ATPase [Anoxybacter fermentans]|uniref:Replication-associated recombination protein A n=1 Tax=Anoxybacter fermentans TaxID=1323375 RepID=A0A3Q9HPZ7_9FIRM|nr:AAA family ATPase [Anoxybacter fermentans]AZR73084.1 AAA family ATPase [Anoxybacter fermentans]